MKRAFLTISFLLLVGRLALAVTYSQPFAASYGFTPAQSGSCDNSYTDNAADSTDGNPVNSVNSICNGRNDSPTTTWYKEMTWQAMGVTAGNIVTTVDGKFDHQRTTQTHAQVANAGPLQIQASGGGSSCMASDVEAIFAYPNSTGLIAWATRDATGVVAVNSGACQTSSTTVRVQFGINPRTGNNASAQTQVNVDNLVLVITEVTPSGRKSQVIVVFNSRGERVRRSFSETPSFSSDTNNGRPVPDISLLRPLLDWWKEYSNKVFS